jgi:hypothetical protein
VEKFKLAFVKCRAAVVFAVLFSFLISTFIAVEGVYGQAPTGTCTMKSPLPEVRAEVAAVRLMAGCTRSVARGIEAQVRSTTNTIQ